MKSLLLLVLLVPVFASAQGKQYHTRLVDQFVKYFNMQQSDSICTLFPDESTTGIKCFMKNAATDGTFDIHGKIKSYEYMGIDEVDPRKLIVYKMIFSKKGVMQLRFTVTKDHRFMVFLLDSA